MKNLLLLFALVIGCIESQAQSPRKFNYQAVVRNNSGAIVANQAVSIRFSIHDASATGIVQYSERHAATTNAFGLVNLQVGTGTNATGVFADITWSTSAKFLQVEADITGGTGFTTLATMELISVPYALSTDKATSFTGSLAGDVNGAQNATVIAANAITTAKLADNSVTSSKIVDNNITAAKIADNAITTIKLADNSVTSAKIVDNNITAAKIADNAITAIKLADNSVTSAKIVDNNITTAKIADNAITTIKLADNSVTTAKIVDNNITAGKIAANAITTIKLADNNVTTVKIADNAVTNLKLADNAVTSDKLAINSVTADKIPTGEIVRGINGLKDNITLAVSGDVTLSTVGNTLTIGTTAAGDITGVTAGAGLTGGGATGAVTLAASFGGNGGANTVSRSDHNHNGQSWSTAAGSSLNLNNTDLNAHVLNIQSGAQDFNGAGLSVIMTNTTSQSPGVISQSLSTNGSGAGVYAEALGNGTVVNNGAKALWGVGIGANTYGVLGEARSTNGIAGYFAASGGAIYAGYFQGNVHVNGTLSKSAGSFKIDHPLDPANKTLSHSFVESPDMMNIYNGNVVLGSDGAAIVTLPDWFEALNRDFRYQLTAMGKPSPGVYVSKEIVGNKFSIAGGAPNGKISWMVTGIRHDTYANEHRIPVEEVKPAGEKGKLLNPAGPAQQVLFKPAPARKLQTQPVPKQ
jgi:hypothetical protein